MSKREDRWYFKTSVLVIAFLCIGPFALPLLWFNPRFSKFVKAVISVIVIALTYYSVVLLSKSINSITTYYQELFKTIGY